MYDVQDDLLSEIQQLTAGLRRHEVVGGEGGSGDGGDSDSRYSGAPSEAGVR